MDTSQERKLAQKVVKQTARNMEPFGYRLAKSRFLFREYPYLIAFFLLYKRRIGPCFRVHFGIRVLSSSFDAQHLNGPCITKAAEYGEDDASVGRCAQTLTELLIRDGIPWIESWLDPQKLISDSGSPLSEADRAGLRGALEGKLSPEHVALSYSLFGMSPPNTALEPTATAPSVLTEP
jgi:hypothetical protein